MRMLAAREFAVPIGLPIVRKMHKLSLPNILAHGRVTGQVRCKLIPQYNGKLRNESDDT